MTAETPDDSERARLLLHIRRLLAGLFIIAAVGGVYFARDFLLPAVFAVFIAVTLRPLVRNLSRRGVPAWATTSVIVVIAVLLAAVAVTAFAGAIMQWVEDAPRIQRDFLSKISGLRSSFEGLTRPATTQLKRGPGPLAFNIISVEGLSSRSMLTWASPASRLAR